MRLSTEARTAAVLAELRRGGATASGLMLRLGWPGREGKQVREILRGLEGRVVRARPGRKGAAIWELQ